MSRIAVPQGSIDRIENGWSVRWTPDGETIKVAVLIEITNDGVLELDRINTHQANCEWSGSNTDTDADPCEIPSAYRALLRDKGFKPAHVDECSRSGDDRGVPA